MQGKEILIPEMVKCNKKVIAVLMIVTKGGTCARTSKTFRSCSRFDDLKKKHGFV